MWRPNESVEEDVSNLPESIRRANAADHAAALGMTALLTKPLFRISNMSGPTERSNVPSLAVLILDPGSTLRSFIGWRSSGRSYVCGGARWSSSMPPFAAHWKIFSSSF
jgi:hypothetical protein